VITLEDSALIRRLHVGEGLPKAQIARQLGISRNTVAKAIASADPPGIFTAAGGAELRAVRAPGSNVVGRDSDDACDGGGRAGRVDWVAVVVSEERCGDPTRLRAC
jgi:hypothetical protein